MPAGPARAASKGSALPTRVNTKVFPEAVMEYYREQGGSVHLEYIFGNPYTVFGQVFEGLEVVDAIAAAERDASDKPLEPITIEGITFEPYAAQ